MKEYVYRALEAVGIEASGDVALACPVDTGLLRNSITYAVDGHGTAMSSYHGNDTHADTDVTRRNGTAGKPLKAVRIGRYDSGPVTDGEPGNKVYIGTNVEYAPYVEYGHSGFLKSLFGKGGGQPFLKPTLKKNKDKYIQICKEYLES